MADIKFKTTDEWAKEIADKALDMIMVNDVPLKKAIYENIIVVPVRCKECIHGKETYLEAALDGSSYYTCEKSFIKTVHSQNYYCANGVVRGKNDV